MAGWREQVDPILQKHLEVIIKEVHKDKEAVLASSNPKMTQLWLAVANLSKQNFDLNQRFNTLEIAVKDFLIAKKTKTRSKKEQKEIESIIKSLGKL